MGSRAFDFGAGDSLLITTDVPTISQITAASRALSYYSLVLELDAALIGELIAALLVTGRLCHYRSICGTSSFSSQSMNTRSRAGTIRVRGYSNEIGKGGGRYARSTSTITPVRKSLTKRIIGI